MHGPSPPFIGTAWQEEMIRPPRAKIETESLWYSDQNLDYYDTFYA